MSIGKIKKIYIIPQFDEVLLIFQSKNFYGSSQQKKLEEVLIFRKITSISVGRSVSVFYGESVEII
jgi:hypothetical protein